MKLALTFVVALGTSAFAQDQMSCPIHAQHMAEAQAKDHRAGVNERGDHAMGFSHARTAHHFRLLQDGGAIEVEAKDAKDTASRDEIRAHLTHIARMFSDGNFEAPMFIHDQVPPGVSVMKERKSRIAYQFENAENGGRVHISTTDKKALEAIHEFLRFQIADHQTGDPIAVQ